MALPDISNLTMDELSALISAASAAYSAAVDEEAVEKAARRAQAAASTIALEALLGPEDSAPYDPVTGANATINGVLKHDTEDHAILAGNVGLCLSLILHGMKADVAAGLNLARLAATE